MNTIEITPAEAKRFFNFVNIVTKCTNEEQRKNMFAPIKFTVKYDELLRLDSIKWDDIKGNRSTLCNPKHPERIVHFITGCIRCSRYACSALFNDICQMLTDDFGGYIDEPIFKSVDDIDEIYVGTDGDHLINFTVIDSKGNIHDLHNVFFENEIVSLLVIVYNIMGIADRICKAV